MTNRRQNPVRCPSADHFNHFTFRLSRTHPSSGSSVFNTRIRCNQLAQDRRTKSLRRVRLNPKTVA